MGLSIEREKRIWLIQRYQSYERKHSDPELERDLLWEMETLVKQLLQLSVMSVTEVHVKMTYTSAYPPIVDVYVCGTCHRKPEAIETEVSTNAYICVFSLVTTDHNHDDHVQEKSWCEDDSVLSCTARYTEESASLLSLVGFSTKIDWCTPWLSESEEHDTREWIRHRKVELLDECVGFGNYLP
ncbi:hypothetical protein FQN54_004706 [Arachnomyces sp. PD_36]|nr:hypothetical protein FQN54_004706 [Arachnomyces sp. PD_36]